MQLQPSSTQPGFEFSQFTLQDPGSNAKRSDSTAGLEAGCRPNITSTGETPGDEWTAVWYANRTKGTQ